MGHLSFDSTISLHQSVFGAVCGVSSMEGAAGIEIYQQLGYQNGYLTPFVEICAPLGPGLYPDYLRFVLSLKA